MDVDIDVGDVAEGVGELFAGFASGSTGKKNNDGFGCLYALLFMAIVAFIIFIFV